MTELGALFEHYGSDKARHGYDAVYSVLLQSRRKSIQAILEVGIGTMIEGVNSSMAGFAGPGYKPGGSLRAWRDYFPNANVLGMDVQCDTQFSEQRIRTMLGDSTAAHPSDHYGSFDLIIDDGSHFYEHQIATLRNLWPLLRRRGFYVIEDLVFTEMFERQDELKAVIGDAPFFFVTPNEVQMLVIAK